MRRECETCIKKKTLYCPNSSECLNTDDMPYYQNRIMILEENQQLKIQISARKEEYRKLENNWNELKNWLDNAIDYINHKEEIDTSDIEEKIILINIINKMQELERSKQDDKQRKIRTIYQRRYNISG